MANASMIPAPVASGVSAAPAQGTYRFVDTGTGVHLQLKDAVTGQWRTVFLTTASGEPALALGPAGS